MLKRCSAPSILGLLTLVVGSLLIPTPAAAQYLDPGAGSILVQVLIAAAVGAAAFLRFYWARITDFFSRLSQRTDKQ